MSIAEGFVHPLKVVCCVFGSVVLMGCSAPGSDRSEAVESQSAALSTTMVRTLGFESLSDWHVLSSTPTLALSTTRTEGNSSLSVKKGGWMQVESRTLSKEQAAPNSFGYSVRIPAGSTGWLGDTQLSINAPSVGIYSQVVGTAALSGPGQFQRVQFTLSNALKAQLNNNYTDLQFRIAINVPSTATNAYLLDQLTFGNICDSNPVIDDGNPCTDDSCDPLLGVRHLPRPNGSACSDGNACTQTDSCSAGACVGTNLVACAPANRCHDAGECDSVTGVCDYPLEDDPTTCREHLTVKLPPSRSHRNFVIVADGQLDLRDQIKVRAPVANMGSVWTHIGNDAFLTDVYSKPVVTVGDRTVLDGMLRKGAGHTVSNSASVTGGISSALFAPPTEHTVSFDLPASGVFEDVPVEVDETSRIAPGPYGHVRLQPRARLELSSGDYYFESFDALEPDSALVLNERKGPVRIFLNDAFTFRSSVVSNVPPAELTVGVLGTGTVRFERPFEGTLIAPYADLVLAPLNGAKHRGSFFAKNITVDAGVIVEPLPREPNSCQKSEFRDAASAQCAGHALEIVSHQGVTRALFEGEEVLATGKRVEPVEDFTFTFSQAVTLEKARSAVQILSTSCPASALKAGCTHDVALDVEAVGGDGKTVRFSNENDPFLPGCQYELRIGDAPLTSGNQCLVAPARLAFLSLSREDGPVLAYETSELRHDPRNHLIASLEFEETISWQADELFRERLPALGLRPGIDSFAAGGPVQETDFAPNAESIFYSQRVNGVPLLGYGYSVQRDRTTGRVLLVTGSVATNVPAPGAAVVTEAAALATARAQVSETVTSPPARLELVPAKDGSKSFKLAYRFVLANTRKFIKRYVDIDATSGAVLSSVAAERPVCDSVDVTTLTEPDPLASVMPVTLDTVQQQHGDFDPTTFYVTEYMWPNGPRAFTLDSRGGLPVPGGSAGRPSQFTLCPGQNFPNVVELPGDDGGPSWDSETYLAAQLHLAGESCLNYFANRPRPFGHDGAQWSGMDGTGGVPLEIRLVHNLSQPPAVFAERIMPGHPAILVDTTFAGGAMIDLVCHEFMHGIWHNFAYPYTTNEGQALDESFADIFGNAAEYAVRQNEESLWCMAPRDVETDCMRWLHAPGSLGHPYVYEGPNWCFEDGVCDPHANGGVMSFWFYLVSRGGSAAGGQGCGGPVPSLDPDPKKAVDLANEILFVALRDHHYKPEGGFHDMANATIAAAKQLHGDGPIKETVIAAWHAVNVWENLPEGDDPWLQPVRDESGVDPWKGFQWRLEEDAPLSDIQIDVSDTFDSNIDTGGPLVSQTVPTEDIDGDTVGTLSIALEPNQKYYWRARPASSEPWGNCNPIHWFITGELPAISSIDTGVLEDVKPGYFSVTPEQIPHAVKYKVQLSDHDTGCKSDPTAEEEIINADDRNDDLPAPRASFFDLQPDTEYWVNVQPIGPENVDGHPATGACYAQLVKTLTLDAPDDLEPNAEVDHWIRYFDEQPEFEWRSPPGTRHHLVRVYPIDEGGNCEYATLAGQETFEDLCDADFSCLTGVDIELAGVRNPLGYCWEVTGFSTDGHESSTVEARLYYRLPGLSGKAPGVQLGFHEMGDPSPLEGDSYDQPVTFSWDPDSTGILGYQVRVGNYPWPLTKRNTPATCYFGQCGHDPANETLPPTLVTEPELELPGELASRGRYCWSAWSVLEDPENPGEIWDRQPFVPITVDCYTSGPSEPEIKFSKPASGDHIAVGQTIEGTIEAAFIPDGQIKVDTSHPATLDLSNCKTTGPYYSDVYDCVIGFSVSGVPEGADFQLDVTTYNSPEFNPPGPLPYDDLPPIHTLQETIHVDSCGALGEACCPDLGRPCDDAQASHCNGSGVCAKCGGLNEPCCTNGGTWCNEANLGCDDGTCRTCGRDKVCCTFAVEECPDDGTVCVSEGNSTRCRGCGGWQQPCCFAPEIACENNVECLNGRCGESCDPVASVSITGPTNVFGEPHYGDVNAVPQAACVELTDLFGKLGSGSLTWEVPPTGPPDHYLITFTPSNLSDPKAVVQPVPGTDTLYTAFAGPPPANACGLTAVVVQAVNNCGTLSSIGDESVVYTLW